MATNELESTGWSACYGSVAGALAPFLTLFILSGDLSVTNLPLAVAAYLVVFIGIPVVGSFAIYRWFRHAPHLGKSIVSFVALYFIIYLLIGFYALVAHT